MVTFKLSIGVVVVAVVCTDVCLPLYHGGDRVRYLPQQVHHLAVSHGGVVVLNLSRQRQLRPVYHMLALQLLHQGVDVVHVPGVHHEVEVELLY